MNHGKFFRHQDGSGSINSTREHPFPEQLRTALAARRKTGVSVPHQLTADIPDKAIVAFDWKDGPQGPRVTEKPTLVSSPPVEAGKQPPAPEAAAPLADALHNDPGRNQLWEIVAIEADQRPGDFTVTLQKDAATRQAKNTDLGVADQVLGIRVGAFCADASNGRRRRFELVELAPDTLLPPRAGADLNPFNFAAWIDTTGPWLAEAPEGASHAHDAPSEPEGDTARYHGRIRIRYRSASPIFIPSHAKPREFFRLRDARGTDRPAIPGSSIKGAVRSLFEAITNSRLGIAHDAISPWPPLYRRRSGTLYVVTTPPDVDKKPDGRLQPCTFAYVGHLGSVRSPTGSPAKSAHDGEVAWHANLFAVASADHAHWFEGDRVDPQTGRPIRERKFEIRYWHVGNTIDFPWQVRERFDSMRGHPHLEAHPDNVRAKTGRTGYRNAGNVPPPYANVETKLFAIQKGTLIFGADDGRRLQCFGKNVNFLWPAPKSPRAMVGDFAPRDARESGWQGSDHAELTFGFAGQHDRKRNTHPFRGRVRFTPLWADNGYRSLGAVELMPLTSPSGTKMKSRTLYYAPRDTKQLIPSTYDDPAESLRGRKFYWHQRSVRDGKSVVARAHDHGALTQGHTGPRHLVDDSDKVSAITIEPIAEGAHFRGEIHFHNLLAHELGALLVALDPAQAFRPAPDAATGAPSSKERFGIKVGKGRPRGLGSLEAVTLELDLLRPIGMRYAALAATPFGAGAPELGAPELGASDFVDKWRAFVLERSGCADASEVAFLADLRQLLRIPEQESVRAYPARFRHYNWLPEFAASTRRSDGAPAGARFPPAMRRARDL